MKNQYEEGFGPGPSTDSYTELMNYRTLMLPCDVDEGVISDIIADMLLLEKRNPEAPINLIVASWGGSLADGLGFYDILKSLECPVNTYAVGKACSAGALILAAGTGKRYAYPNTRIMIHQPSGGMSYGTITQNKIAAKNDEEWKRIFLQALAESTGQPFEKVMADCEQDYWMSAEEAKAYGIVDEIVTLPRLKTKNA